MMHHVVVHVMVHVVMHVASMMTHMMMHGPVRRARFRRVRDRLHRCGRGHLRGRGSADEGRDGEGRDG